MNMTQQRPESKELSILVKLLKMTTSTHDHEALSAIRLANVQILKLGTDWEDLLNGKVTLVADPFTSIPEPQSAPKAPSPFAPHPPPRPRPPPPPPQPVYYRDAAEIQGYLDDLMFATLTPQVAIRFGVLEKAWLTNKQLDAADYSELRGLANSYAPRKRKRRRT